MSHRILVVEDDAAIMANTLRVLRLEGFEADSACDGLEALQRIELQKPDLILCDIRMPRMTGDELLDHLRARPDLAQIPLIFATASAEPSGRSERILRGAVDYLVKPYDFKVMLGAVRKLLVGLPGGTRDGV